MKVTRVLRAAPFLEKVGSLLEADEATNNLPLGILSQRAREPYQGDEERRPFFAFVEQKGRVTFVMVMTPPHNLIVTGDGEQRKAAGTSTGTLAAGPADESMAASIDTAISFLLSEKVLLPGVIGPRDIATRFASAWSQRTGCAVEVQMDQMIYRLDCVTEMAYPPGRLIRATEEHVDRVAEWTVGFSEVTPERMTFDEALEGTRKRIHAERLYLWRDAVPVSMAWKARTTPHGAIISGVYTPPPLRNRGYATACVASLSQRLLDEGYQFCALYADLANPISNSIYRRMGYRPIRASVDYQFLTGGHP